MAWRQKGVNQETKVEGEIEEMRLPGLEVKGLEWVFLQLSRCC